MEDCKIFIKFLRLAQKHFKKEREIDFYADKIGITSEDLVKIIQETSDSNLLEWLEVMEKVEAESMLTNNQCQE